MWYDDFYKNSIKTIKEAKKRLSIKEYSKKAMEQDLLSPDALQWITNKKFNVFVKEVRSGVIVA